MRHKARIALLHSERMTNTWTLVRKRHGERNCLERGQIFSDRRKIQADEEGVSATAHSTASLNGYHGMANSLERLEVFQSRCSLCKPSLPHVAEGSAARSHPAIEYIAPARTPGQETCAGNG